ncbi:MAG: acetylxylan esterase [Candidatus Omnitrophica bacterium]|nr:acetylxylan esterase [Candidatus Omnitrophota bacterium]
MACSPNSHGRIFLLLASSFHLLALSGCAHLSYHPSRPTQPLPPEIAAYYAYPNHSPEATIQAVAKRPRFTESLVQFPLSVSGFEPTEPVVELEWFESTQPGRRPAIVFNPILGGDYPLERGICRYLAGHGFHVAMVHRKTLKISPEHSVDRLELLLRQGVIRIRQVVDWMERHERVDPERLGSFGISMGGMASVMSAAVEPRLKAHVVALAGGSIPDVLLRSKDTLLTKPLANYLARNQMVRSQFEAQLRKTVQTDPLLLAPYVDPSRLFLLITWCDRTVGTANELALWRALGQPEATFVPLGHYTAYLSLPYLKRASLRFFRRHLL